MDKREWLAKDILRGCPEDLVEDHLQYEEWLARELYSKWVKYELFETTGSSR